jgi:hypothetical protein
MSKGIHESIMSLLIVTWTVLAVVAIVLGFELINRNRATYLKQMELQNDLAILKARQLQYNLIRLSVESPYYKEGK